MAEVAAKMEAALTEALSPSALKITDDSHQHAGHAGAPDGGESHFTVEITAEAFAGKNRVARHRLVNAALSELLKTRIHALAIKAKAPGE
ncbi:BolA family transcriptional regulator [Maricaulaceae bacterium EIL42A08]|nr:BolA family transcriptional regulator [Maricaulaceae bacterium EIL42A08]MCP2679150.1 BolA family transcriptional regulator [Maricaulaceae bacterium NA33B04]